MKTATATTTAKAPKTTARAPRATTERRADKATPAAALTPTTTASPFFPSPTTTPAPATATANSTNGKKRPDGVAVSAEIVGPLLKLSFANGRIITVDSNALSPEIVQHAIMHGLKQKLVDGAAIGRDPVTGRTATIDDKFAAVNDIYLRMIGSETDAPAWNKTREGGAGPVKGGMLVAAMMEVTGKTHEAVIEFLDKKTNEEKAALRDNARIAPVIARLQAAKAAALAAKAKAPAVDSDAMLDGLMGAEGETADDTDTDE